MKSIFFVVSLLIVVLNANAQNQTVDKIYAQYKDKGCFVLELSGNFLSGMLKDESKNNEELKQLANQIDRFKIINIPNEVHVFTASSLNDLKKSIRKDAYEDLMAVKNSDGDFNVFIKENRGTVKEIVVIANSNDGILLMSLSGNIPKSKVEELTGGIRVER